MLSINYQIDINWSGNYFNEGLAREIRSQNKTLGENNSLYSNSKRNITRWEDSLS